MPRGNPRGELVLRVWPNGEFGIGRQKTVDRLTEGVVRASNSPLASDEAYAEWLRLYCEKVGQDVKAVIYPGRDMTSEFIEGGLGGVPPLGSSHAVNSHSPKKARGSGGITSLGKKMLRNGAYLLQRKAGKHRLAMFTGTIPRVSDEVERMVSVAWPDVVRRFQQEVNRLLSRAGLSPWTIGCTEIQERRILEHGGFPLHLHMVFQGRRGKAWAYPPSVFRELWKRILVRSVPALSESSFDASTRIEAVRKDAASYIAKYASKGVRGGVLEVIGEGYRVPTCWVHVTGGLKTAVKKEVGYYVGEMAEVLQWACYCMKQAFRYVGDVRIDTPRGEVSIAWYGRLKMGFSCLAVCQLNVGKSPVFDREVLTNVGLDKLLLAV